MTEQQTKTQVISLRCVCGAEVSARVHYRLLSHVSRAVLTARSRLTRLHTALSLRYVPCGALVPVCSVPGQCHAHSRLDAAVSDGLCFRFFAKSVLFVG